MKNVSVCMGEFIWSPEEGIDVSSHGRPPYKLLSPFSHDSEYKIPVPGSEHIRADSVEGIWQGLKIFNGSHDPSLFTGRPHKKKGKPEGHLYGKEVIAYVDARKNIYVPAYIYHAINNALPKAWPDLEQMLKDGNAVLHDVETNGSIENPMRPLAHSAILVELLNVVKDAPIPKIDVCHPNPESSFRYLHEQIDALVAYRESLPAGKKHLLDEVVTFAYLFSQNEHKQTFALRMIKAASIQTERLERYKPTAQTQKPYEDCLRR